MIVGGFCWFGVEFDRCATLLFRILFFSIALAAPPRIESNYACNQIIPLLPYSSISFSLIHLCSPFICYSCFITSPLLLTLLHLSVIAHSPPSLCYRSRSPISPFAHFSPALDHYSRCFTSFSALALHHLSIVAYASSISPSLAHASSPLRCRSRPLSPLSLTLPPPHFRLRNHQLLTTRKRRSDVRTLQQWQLDSRRKRNGCYCRRPYFHGFSFVCSRSWVTHHI